MLGRKQVVVLYIREIVEKTFCKTYLRKIRYYISMLYCSLCFIRSIKDFFGGNSI